jgi:hypothetical protein
MTVSVSVLINIIRIRRPIKPTYKKTGQLHLSNHATYKLLSCSFGWWLMAGAGLF